MRTCEAEPGSQLHQNWFGFWRRSGTNPRACAPRNAAGWAITGMPKASVGRHICPRWTLHRGGTASFRHRRGYSPCWTQLALSLPPLPAGTEQEE